MVDLLYHSGAILFIQEAFILINQSYLSYNLYHIGHILCFLLSIHTSMKILFKPNFNYLFPSLFPPTCLWAPWEQATTLYSALLNIPNPWHRSTQLLMHEWINESMNESMNWNLAWMTIQKFTPFFTWQNFIYLNYFTMHDFYPSSLLSSN